MPKRTSSALSLNSRWIILSIPAMLGPTLLAVTSPAFSFTQIDVPGATDTEAYGINDAGQIVGAFGNNTGVHGFLDTGGSYTTIVVPGAPLITTAQNINNVGQIVGIFGNNFVQHGFLDTGGNFTQLDVPGLSGLQQYTIANGINDAGQIVGSYSDSQHLFMGQSSQGFVYTGGNFTPLNVPGATNTAAYGINNLGQIVGTFSNSSLNSHGFLDTGGNFSQIDVPGATDTVAYGINDAGQIVGTFDDSTGHHSFLYTGGNFAQLDVPGAFQTLASDINSTEQIVGWYSSSATGTGIHGFLATGTATGDPHFTTYDGVHYDYQGIGDFLLARSTVDQFDVQVRTRPWSNWPAATIMSGAAATLCNHNVTFDIDRASAGGSFVWIDGSPSSLSVASPVLTLGTCKIDELSPEHYQVVWNTGEMLDVTNTGSYLDLSSELSWIDGLGSMEGLLSSDLSPDLWRVTAATSLLDPVPEPGTLILLATGLVAFGATRRRATFPKPHRSTSCGFDDASSLGNVHAK